jgi:SAM-dependent methyltransferase/predicted transcriptional regulator
MTDPRATLDHLSAGYQDAVILLTANHLGLFGALVGEPQTATDLAQELDLDPRAVDRILCALAGQGLLDQTTPGTFALREEYVPMLDPDSPETMHSILDHHFHLLERWVKLAGVARTGDPARDRSEPRTERSLRAFICGMKDISRRSSETVADALPEIGRCRRMLDLGGGPGTSAITFCKRWPELAAVVFDLPEVVPIAREQIAAAGLEDRIATMPGDYHQGRLLADGQDPYDLVYVSNIIHSLDEQDTRSLLTAAANVLAPGGLLVVKDFYLEDDRTGPAFATRFAINMLVGTEGGKSYTWREVEQLCAELGLGEVRRVPVATHSGLVVARRG